MPHVLTITGPSGAGKSTTARYLLAHKDASFRPQLVPKFTTRPPRADDQGEVNCVSAIPVQCDLRYEHCEMRYGLELSSLFNAVIDGFSPIVILNEVQAVEVVRFFGTQARQSIKDPKAPVARSSLREPVRSIFIFREEPSLERYRALAKLRGVTDEREPVWRFLQARAFYRIYGENIHLFDHVILNSGETFEDLDTQVKQIIRGLKQDPDWSLHEGDEQTFSPRLFVVVGTPGSGKDWLIQAVHNIGAQQAQIVPKHTSRKRRKNDRDEMICSDDPGHNLDTCDIIYENYGDKYGIKSSRIWEGLESGVSQIVVVSNVDAIANLRRLFNKSTVLVYIHSMTSADEYRRAEVVHGEDPKYVERRAEEYRLAFDVYLENFLDFDHVLINSGDPEDLLAQTFRLLRIYEREVPRLTTSERVWIDWARIPSRLRIIGENR